LQHIGLIIDYIFLIIMIATSFLYYNKYKDTKLRLLPWIFVLSFVVEVTAISLRLNDYYNVWLYNQYINIEFLFFLWIFYRYIENLNFKKVIILGSILYEFYFIFGIIISNNMNVFQTYPFAFAQILIIIVLFAFIIQMISSDKILHIQQYLIFWVSLGLLFYYIVPFPLNVSESLISKESLSREMMSFLRQIQYVGNILMYILITYGYIWSSKTYTSQ
jgi:hypothetical protein